MWHAGLAFSAIEVKAADDDAATFSGVASTDDVDLQDDVIEAGAFGAINPRHVAMLRDHDFGKIIGVWNAFEQDGKTLRVEGKILPGANDVARETYLFLQEGALSGLSVGYLIRKGGAVWDEANNVRRIKKARLLECSLVAVPANTRARVRSVKALIAAHPELATGCLDGLADEEIELIARGLGVGGEGAPRLNLSGIDGFERDRKDGTDARLLAALDAVASLTMELRQCR